MDLEKLYRDRYTNVVRSEYVVDLSVERRDRSTLPCRHDVGSLPLRIRSFFFFRVFRGFSSIRVTLFWFLTTLLEFPVRL